MGIEQIVDIQISIAQAATAQQNFNRALILGSTHPAQALGLYSSLTAVATDYASSTDEYKAANAIFEQIPAPTDLLIAQIPIISAPYSSGGKKVVELNVNAGTRAVTINGTIFEATNSFESPHEDENRQENLQRICDLIIADSGYAASGYIAEVTTDVTESPVDTDYYLFIGPTHDGVSLTITNHNADGETNLTITDKTLSITVLSAQDIPTTLTNLLLSGDLGKSWYGLDLATPNQVDILAAAGWVEANQRIMATATNESGAKTVGTSDTAYLLKNAGQTRTLYQYTGTPAEHPDAALMGFALAHEPGTFTLANKVLAGVTPDILSDTEIGYLDGKNANYFIEIAGAGRERVGRTASGQWLDVIMGVDWIKSDMTTNIFNLIALQDKVPFTDAGIDLVVTQVRLTLQTAVAKGILASFTITAPKASDFSQAEKQSRVLTGVEFTGVLAGAIQKTIIRGVVTA